MAGFRHAQGVGRAGDDEDSELGVVVMDWQEERRRGQGPWVDGQLAEALYVAGVSITQSE